MDKTERPIYWLTEGECTQDVFFYISMWAETFNVFFDLMYEAAAINEEDQSLSLAAHGKALFRAFNDRLSDAAEACSAVGGLRITFSHGPVREKVMAAELVMKTEEGEELLKRHEVKR